jgi:hypothetical protein
MLLDPRPISAAAEANERVFALGPVLGIEVTVPALAERCTLGNIDPQHTDGDVSKAAIEVALEEQIPPRSSDGWIFDGRRAWVTPCPDCGQACSYACTVTGNLLPELPITLTTVRADLDSVGAMAVLTIKYAPYADILLSDEGGILQRIAAIATADKTMVGGWPGPRALPRPGDPPEPQRAELGIPPGLSQLVFDFKTPLKERVFLILEWLRSGWCAGLPEADEAVQSEFDQAVEKTDVWAVYTAPDDVHGLREFICTPGDIIELAGNSRVAYAESTERYATNFAYRIAPVIVMMNPEFKFRGADAGVKFTVAQFSPGYVDLPAVLADLQEMEQGWGGSPTIIGSPQGSSSELSPEEVVATVFRHLAEN